MAKFTKYKNQARKKRRRLSRSEADIIAAKNMITDRQRGVYLPLSHYDRQSDEMSGNPSRNIYDN